MKEHESPAVDSHRTDAESLTGWLSARASLTLPRWAFVGAGLVALGLLLVALD